MNDDRTLVDVVRKRHPPSPHRRRAHRSRHPASNERERIELVLAQVNRAPLGLLLRLEHGPDGSPTTTRSPTGSPKSVRGRSTRALASPRGSSPARHSENMTAPAAPLGRALLKSLCGTQFTSTGTETSGSAGQTPARTTKTRAGESPASELK